VIESLLQFARENYNTLVVLVGVSLLGASSGIIGAFAVLRKRALTGDALSHAALPGLCLAFLIVRERQLTALLSGALASGIIGIAIISALGRWTRVREDAAIGAVLTVFFGLGIVLLKIIQNLEAVGSKAGLNSYIFGKTAGMTRGDVYVILAASLVCLALIVFLFKEFQLVTFDGGFARSLGWPVYALDLLLMSLVAVAVVIGLPNVGVVLVSALLIMPGAAARFWTDRLSTLLVVAGIFGFTTGLIGTILSASFEQLPAGPIIVLTGAAFFLASLLFGIRRGAIARILQHRRFQHQWHEHQLLRALYESQQGAAYSNEIDRDAVLALRAWAPAELDRLLTEARLDGLVATTTSGQWRLTDRGLAQAVEVTRAQRLWEAFLIEYPDQAGSVANLATSSVADVVPEATVELLRRKLQAAGRWPTEEAAA
jgi:manganese/zinc/iron transport system permease protein